MVRGAACNSERMLGERGRLSSEEETTLTGCWTGKASSSNVVCPDSEEPLRPGPQGGEGMEDGGSPTPKTRLLGPFAQQLSSGPA